MKRRILVASAIAASVLLVVLGFWPGDGGNGRVYAFSDVPAILDATRTIHFKGRGCVAVSPEPPDEQKWFPLETWLDLENGRSRTLAASYGVRTGGSGAVWSITPYENVSDGQYRMRIDHTEKTVSFVRDSPYEHLLIHRRAANGLFAMMFGYPFESSNSAKVGQESIEGVTYDIWESDAILAGSNDVGAKAKCWLSPETGQMGRIHTWRRIQGGSTPGTLGQHGWVPVWQFERIERDVMIPAGTFETEPPAGYSVTNAKADAVVKDLDDEGGPRVNNLELDIRISFTLDDGSVIVAWRGIDHDEPAAGADLFASLEVGGPLPELPVELVGLKPYGRDADITYEGRHLAWTEKNGKRIEWAIYVPRAAPPARASFPMYVGLHRFNPSDSLKGGSMTPSVNADIVVDRDDFDRFVRGAMAELSDDGQAPAYVTYDNVTALSQQIRVSPADNAEGAND
ncbi:MAG: hypothetical protein JXA69_03380 [Phycisphaerae bacterium]|nr:hypothetical protein [Phycisphaerae bacterium]